MAAEVDEFVNRLLGDLKQNKLQLPTLPQIALKITDTIEDPNSTAKDVTRVVATDAALSARLIQVANSALYRSAAPVENVQMAVTRLGMKQVRNIATSLLIRQLFHTKYAGLKKRLERLWSHSAHVAAISAVLARKHTKLKADEAMLAGLIHDIGELPILAYAEKFPDIASNESTLDEVTEKIGTLLGKAMLQAWKFAPAIVTVVAEHERLNRNTPGDADYCDVVLVANLHSYIGTQHRLARADWTGVQSLKKLGLSPEESINAMKEAREEIVEMQKLLSA